MEEEKLSAVYYARCSTEEENQKDALVRQAAEAEEAIRARGWSLWMPTWRAAPVRAGRQTGI